MKTKRTQPLIRFKGFNEDWEEKKLKDLGNTFNGLSGKTKKDFGHGEAKYITYINVNRNAISDSEGLDKIEIDNSQNEVKYGDVLFTTSSETPDEVGLSSVWLNNMSNVYLNSFCFGYRLTQNINPLFLAYLLRSNYFRSKVILLAQGISRYNISKKQLMKTTINISGKEEQAKIGNFINNLDKLISLQEQKLELLEQVKKGLLQKLFPKKGSKVPEIRFRGFEGEWNEVKLGNISPLRGGYAFNSSSYTSEGLPIVRISNILEDGNVGGEFTFYPRNINAEKFTLMEYDILIAMSGATTGKISRILNSDYEKYYQNQRVGYFTKTKTIDYDFLYFLLNSNKFKTQLNSVLVSGAQPNISSKEIDSFNFIISKDYKEQNKIGFLLNNIDSYIKANNSKLQQLQSIKQSLLQQMFI